MFIFIIKLMNQLSLFYLIIAMVRQNRQRRTTNKFGRKINLVLLLHNTFQLWPLSSMVLGDFILLITLLILFCFLSSCVFTRIVADLQN